MSDKDWKRHQGNQDIIRSSVGKISGDEWLASEISMLCGGGAIVTMGCTSTDAKAWIKAIKQYYNDVFLRAFNSFNDALEQFEVGGGTARQRTALDKAIEASEIYDAKIGELSDIRTSPFVNYEYYNGKVKDIVALWDVLAGAHDLLMENLPRQIDPSDIAGKSAAEIDKNRGGGGAISWQTVALVAGVSGLIFVGVKLWNE